MTNLRTITRRLATGLAVVAGVVVLSATPAEARPIIDPTDYLGPVHSALFAGATTHASGAVR